MMLCRRSNLERIPPGLLLGLLLLLIPSVGTAELSSARVFVNGLWFDGGAFVPRTVVVSDGLIVDADPEAALDAGAERIDLEGGFVVPAFGEAHHHTVAYMEDRARSFLRAGIFYAKVQNIDVEFGPEVRERYATPETVDVSLSMAGLTATDAHPVQIGLRFMRDASSSADLDGRWVHLIDSAEDVATKWPAVLASEPDFIKIFLLNSEAYDQLAGDAGVAMRYRGMNPDWAPLVVERAHASGLRVSAHVRTAADFGHAVRAGVDELAHLPGFAIGPDSEDELTDARLMRELEEPARYKIRVSDAELAAERDLIQITTVGRRVDLPPDLPENVEALYRKSRAVHDEVARHNLALLKGLGVRIVIGSDAGEGNSVEEALGLRRFEVFTAVELLRMLSQETPRMIFPERRIGCLEEGCEASFLALEADPLENLAAIERISRRFKQGRELVLAD